MKFNTDRHFIYITTQDDENKQQLQSYYKLMEEDLEEITKEWSVDLLIPADPMELSNINSLEAAHDTLGPSKTKKNEEAQDICSTLAKTTFVSPEKGGDDEDIDGTNVE
jgi:hypothetical protein